MTARAKKLTGLGVALLYVILFVVLLFTNFGAALFGALSFVFGGLTLYFYESGKLKDALETAQELAQEAKDKRASKKESNTENTTE